MDIFSFSRSVYKHNDYFFIILFMFEVNQFGWYIVFGNWSHF